MKRSLRENDATAALAVVATVTLGYLVRHTLNPDGVAYLDLAAVLRRGDLHHFVQGYWSPLYPALLGLIGLVSGNSTSSQIAAAHLLNVAAVGLTIGVIWQWARAARTAWFGRGAIAALIVCSAEPPRIEALTPDLILLCTMACIGYELVVHRGEHWVRLGLLFGLAYLIKTGIWPWLVVAMVMRTLMVSGRSARLDTLRSHAITIALTLCWIVPMSVQAGHATLGSTGSLNAAWYLASSDGRTPDTHAGEHLRYRSAPANDSSTIQWAEFDSEAGWTYHPWSSPDDWSQGILSDQSKNPTLGWLLHYWIGTVRLTASLWLRTLFVFVLIPAVWIGRGCAAGTTTVTAEGPAKGAACCAHTCAPTTLVAMVLGAIGIGEYIVIHAEPRLIAPFALLFALAALDWMVGDREAETAAMTIPPTIDRQALSLLGIVVAGYVTVTRIYHAVADERRISAGLIQLENAHRSAYHASPSDGMGLASALSADVPAHPRVVIVGPALPVMANVFWIGGRIVAQLPPASAASLSALPAERQRDLMKELFHGRADVLWLTDPDGGFQIVHVP